MSVSAYECVRVCVYECVCVCEWGERLLSGIAAQLFPQSVLHNLILSEAQHNNT